MATPVETLRRSADFEALQRSGTRKAHPLLVVRLAPNGLPRTRVGFSTGRRLGGAVVRNRVRRRLREIVRHLAPRIQPGWDVLIQARPGSTQASYAELREAVERLFRRGGILHQEEGAP